MTREIRIYVEGGGDRESKERMRLGFGEFLNEVRDMARRKRVRWRIVACGPRGAAIDNFRTALAEHPSAFNVLLVDSEGPVSGTPWEHLARRDRWSRPEGAEEKHCQLMVQAMEAWFLADPDALESFFGNGFRRTRLSSRGDVEGIPKDDLAPSLDRAAAGTAKGGYDQGWHAGELLRRIDPGKVRGCATHCERLFVTLAAAIGDDPSPAGGMCHGRLPPGRGVVQPWFGTAGELAVAHKPEGRRRRRGQR